MKSTVYSLILVLLLWPAGGALTAPGRFTEPDTSLIPEEGSEASTDSIAKDTGVSDSRPGKPAAPAPEQANSQEQTPLMKKPPSLMEELTGQPAEDEEGMAQMKRPMTISEALSEEDDPEGTNTEQTVQEEIIEWVGKDRRIKRVIKVPATIYLKSPKPANKLIITDEYHPSKTEMLGIAEVRHYGARPEESKWLYSGSKFLCELRHPIPGFGYAVMKQGVEDPLQFVVEGDGLMGGSGRARIQSKPPQWKRFTLVKDLGVINIEPKGNVLFSVPGEWVKRLLLELEEGMQPTISFWDDDTGGEDVILTVSSFNFQKHLPDFARCLGNLLPYSFKDVRKRTVYFGYDKYQLSAAQRQRLSKLIEYVKLDEEVKKVDITGFSDSVGFARYNKTLAQRRANEVKKYLLAQGLPADKLAVQARGEKGKKHSNRTAAGRKMNRRVEVTLIK